MLGWEYPPVISGGLGIASQGLARELSLEHEVDFLLPKLFSEHQDHSINLIQAEGKYNSSLWKKSDIIREKISFLEIGLTLLPYAPPSFFREKKTSEKSYNQLSETEESQLIRFVPLTGRYGNLQKEIKKYALIATQIALENKYDVAHGHDWMTFPACMAIKKALDIPFITHIHSTEFDRNGSYGDPEIKKIEKEGLEAAESIIAVSQRVKQQLVDHYKIPDHKITVVPNGGYSGRKTKKIKSSSPKIGFVGRFTHQKGPMKFLDIARELSSKHPDIQFVMAGDGYLNQDIKKKISQLNLSSKVHLPGFLSLEKVDQLMKELDILVVPSASEPFGLVVLEALTNQTLVIAASGSGICEFIPSLPNEPYWDVFSFCNRISELLNDRKLYQQTLEASLEEASKLSWGSSALETSKIYTKLVHA